MLKRPIRIDGDVAYVTLTKGYLAMIDTADTHFVAGWNWRALVDGRKRFLGLHATPEAAHTAYCKASAELHGEYGRVA